MDLNVINQVFSLLLMMAVGALLRKRKIVNDAVLKGFSETLMFVTLPFMILYSFNFSFSRDMLANGIVMFCYSVAAHLFLILLSQLLYWKFDASKKYIFHFSTVFSNCGFIGFPLIFALYGKIGVFYTSIFVIAFNLFAFTYGIMLFTGRSSMKNMLKSLVNPPLIATFLGLLIFLFSIKLPSPILSTLETVGSMTTVLSMFIIGAMLADVSLKEVFKGLDVYYLSLIKLVVAPFLCYLLFVPFTTDTQVLAIAVILVAMPTASLGGVFAEKFNGNRAAISRCTFLTTVLSMLTIPLVVSAL